MQFILFKDHESGIYTKFIIAKHLKASKTAQKTVAKQNWGYF